MSRPSRVVLGEVVAAHGLRGELRVRYFGEGPANLLRVTEVELVGAPATGTEAGRRHEVAGARPGRRGEVRLALRDIGSRDAAAALAGLLVRAEASQLEPLEEGEYYGFELVGCAVEATDGRALGRVRAHWDTGSDGVLVLEDPRGKEVLLPAAGALLRHVDVEGGRIVIEVPEGLLEPG